MNRTTIISSLVLSVLLLAPAASYADTPATQPVDTLQGLSSALAAVAVSVNSLASSTEGITIANGQTVNGIDASKGGELMITNVGSYHTDSPPYSFAPSMHLSKLVFQYIPCTAVSPLICASSQKYPPVTSELAVNGTTNYLNYTIQLTALSTTSATLQVTDASAYTNIQNELNDLSARIKALLGT